MNQQSAHRLYLPAETYSRSTAIQGYVHFYIRRKQAVKKQTKQKKNKKHAVW